MSHRYNAVLFDLLSALLDSWKLWDEIAGDPTSGREWRLQYLKAAAGTRQYEPYIPLIQNAAEAVRLAPSKANVLASRWGELAPWPEATEIVSELASEVRIGAVTNCSEELGVQAARKIGAEFDVVLTAERAGCYKPDQRIYRMAIKEIGESPERILYVAGSPYDVCGAAAAGMSVYWHNRTGLVDVEASSTAACSADSLNRIRNMMC